MVRKQSKKTTTKTRPAKTARRSAKAAPKAQKTAKKAARKSLKGISRIDQPEKHNHGWFVRVTRKGITHSAFFTDRKHGGKTKALAAAKKGLKNLRAKYPPMSRQEFAKVQRRRTKSGIVGVTQLTKQVKGVDYQFWQATWSPRPGVIEKKVFSISKYGDEKAKQLAIKARRKGLREMED